MELYGCLELDDLTPQLKLVEKLGDKFSHSYVWLFTAGKLALRCKIWGQAKKYLEQAVQLKSSSEARQLLAMALDALDMKDEAYQQLKGGWQDYKN